MTICFALQDIAETSEQRQRCFDRIESIVEENASLKTDVGRLQMLLEQLRKEEGVLQAQNQNLTLELGRAVQEKQSMTSPFLSSLRKTFVLLLE